MGPDKDGPHLPTTLWNECGLDGLPESTPVGLTVEDPWRKGGELAAPKQIGREDGLLLNLQGRFVHKLQCPEIAQPPLQRIHEADRKGLEDAGSSTGAGEPHPLMGDRADGKVQAGSIR